MGYSPIFDERKAAQAAAFLLFHARGTLSVIKLMKLMYLSERLSLERYGEPLTGDKLVSMQQGPVLSMTLECFSGGSRIGDEGGWESWIADREGHNVSLRNPSGIRSPEDDLLRLSDSDLEVLGETWGRFGHWDQWELVKYTHSPECPEWVNPNGSSVPITYKTLFTKLGFDREQTTALVNRIEEQTALNSVMMKS